MYHFECSAIENNFFMISVPLIILRGIYAYIAVPNNVIMITDKSFWKMRFIVTRHPMYRYQSETNSQAQLLFVPISLYPS